VEGLRSEYSANAAAAIHHLWRNGAIRLNGKDGRKAEQARLPKANDLGETIV
jgi:hypothetical protein